MEWPFIFLADKAAPPLSHSSPMQIVQLDMQDGEDKHSSQHSEAEKYVQLFCYMCNYDFGRFWS